MAGRLNRRGFLATVAGVFGAAFAVPKVLGQGGPATSIWPHAYPGDLLHGSVWIQVNALTMFHPDGNSYGTTEFLRAVDHIAEGRPILQLAGQTLFPVYNAIGMPTAEMTVGVLDNPPDRDAGKWPVYRWLGGDRFEKISAST